MLLLKRQSAIVCGMRMLGDACFLLFVLLVRLLFFHAFSTKTAKTSIQSTTETSISTGRLHEHSTSK
jgi:hypothetical protein